MASESISLCTQVLDVMQALNHALKWHPGAGEAPRWHSSGLIGVDLVYSAGCTFDDGLPENMTTVPAMVLDSLLSLNDMEVDELADDADDDELGETGMTVSGPCTVRDFIKVGVRQSLPQSLWQHNQLRLCLGPEVRIHDTHDADGSYDQRRRNDNPLQILLLQIECPRFSESSGSCSPSCRISMPSCPTGLLRTSRTTTEATGPHLLSLRA